MITANITTIKAMNKLLELMKNSIWIRLYHLSISCVTNVDYNVCIFLHQDSAMENRILIASVV